jgi:hypothetical protein
VDVHAGAVDAGERLGHEGGVEAVHEGDRLTTKRKVAMLSAVVTASPYLKSISCWPGATSWWAASISKPIASSALMSRRRPRRGREG